MKVRTVAGAESGVARRERERTGETGDGGEGVAGPFDGAVGPVGDGPGLHVEARAARGGEAHGRGGLHGAFGPGDTPTDADGSGGGGAAEPVERDGFGGENGEGK